MGTQTNGEQMFLRLFRLNAGYLFRVALALTGNRREAELLVAESLWTLYRREGGIRRRGAFRAAAVRGMLRPEADGVLGAGDWTKMPGPDTPAGQVFGRLEGGLQRAVVAYLECVWQVREAARRCGVSPAALREALREIRAQPGGPEFAGDLHKILLAAQPPDMSGVARELESRAAGWRRPRNWVGKTMKGLLLAALTLLLCGGFWLLAVLMEN